MFVHPIWVLGALGVSPKELVQNCSRSFQPSRMEIPKTDFLYCEACFWALFMWFAGLLLSTCLWWGCPG